MPGGAFFCPSWPTGRRSCGAGTCLLQLAAVGQSLLPFPVPLAAGHVAPVPVFLVLYALRRCLPPCAVFEFPPVFSLAVPFRKSSSFFPPVSGGLGNIFFAGHGWATGLGCLAVVFRLPSQGSSILPSALLTAGAVCLLKGSVWGEGRRAAGLHASFGGRAAFTLPPSTCCGRFCRMLRHFSCRHLCLAVCQFCRRFF